MAYQFLAPRGIGIPCACLRGGNALDGLAFFQTTDAGARLEMHVSTAQEAILEQIGQTLVDLNEDVTMAPLPEAMVVLLNQSPTPRLNATNILCYLIEALSRPDGYRFFERNGELFLEPIQLS
jgi:hypothetical protein